MYERNKRSVIGKSGVDWITKFSNKTHSNSDVWAHIIEKAVNF